MQLLSDIEEHLKCTITQCEPDIKVPVDEFDGKVSYGQRRALGGECLMLSTTHSTRAAEYVHLFSVLRILGHTEIKLLLLLLPVGSNYKGHVDVLAPTVQELAGLEREAQSSFLHLGYLKNQLFRAFWRH